MKLMNKKKQIFIIITLIIGIIIALFVSFKVFSNYRYEHMFDKNKVPGRECFEPDSVLCAVLKGKKYDDLKLSENFKKKYPNRESIIPYVKKYGYFDNGYDPFNHNIIMIGANKTNLFGYVNEDYDTDFYFQYSVANNLLDDIKLIKKIIYDPITNEIIEEENY